MALVINFCYTNDLTFFIHPPIMTHPPPRGHGELQTERRLFSTHILIIRRFINPGLYSERCCCDFVGDRAGLVKHTICVLREGRKQNLAKMADVLVYNICCSCDVCMFSRSLPLDPRNFDCFDWKIA